MIPEFELARRKNEFTAIPRWCGRLSNARPRSFHTRLRKGAGGQPPPDFPLKEQANRSRSAPDRHIRIPNPALKSDGSTGRINNYRGREAESGVAKTVCLLS